MRRGTVASPIFNLPIIFGCPNSISVTKEIEIVSNAH